MQLEERRTRNGEIVHLEALDRCPGCASKRVTDCCVSEDVVLGSGPYRVQQCSDCTLAFLNPRPTEADVPTVNQTLEALPTHGTLLTEVRRRRLAMRGKSYLAHHSGSSLRCLDVGAGDGFFAEALATLPRVDHVVACDYMEEAPASLRERPNSKLSYQRYDATFAEKEAYDVVFCRHMLEHVHDPTAWVAKLRGLIKTGGLLVLEVPRWDAIWLDIFGGDYSHISAPAHLNQYTQRALEQQLKGFDIVRWGQTHGVVLGRSIMSKLKKKYIDVTAPIALAALPLEILVERISGRWACLTCVARKV
jgi:2-polyprenyl-3-methyl-5-hydroxy-6-metoxy-1,4-benzoquinol methylase